MGISQEIKFSYERDTKLAIGVDNSVASNGDPQDGNPRETLEAEF